MITKVCPIEECEICFENIPIIEFGRYKCWKEGSRHMICNNCVNRENQRRKENRITTPNECILCKPFQEKIEHVTININNNNVNNVINNHIREMQRNQRRQINSREDTLYKEIFCSCGMMACCWIFGIILWNFYVCMWNLSHGNDIEDFNFKVTFIEIFLVYVILFIKFVAGLLCCELVKLCRNV